MKTKLTIASLNTLPVSMMAIGKEVQVSSSEADMVAISKVNSTTILIQKL